MFNVLRVQSQGNLEFKIRNVLIISLPWRRVVSGLWFYKSTQFYLKNIFWIVKFTDMEILMRVTRYFFYVTHYAI